MDAGRSPRPPPCQRAPSTSIFLSVCKSNADYHIYRNLKSSRTTRRHTYSMWDGTVIASRYARASSRPPPSARRPAASALSALGAHRRLARTRTRAPNTPTSNHQNITPHTGDRKRRGVDARLLLSSTRYQPQQIAQSVNARAQLASPHTEMRPRDAPYCCCPYKWHGRSHAHAPAHAPCHRINKKGGVVSSSERVLGNVAARRGGGRPGGWLAQPRGRLAPPVARG